MPGVADWAGFWSPQVKTGPCPLIPNKLPKPGVCCSLLCSAQSEVHHEHHPCTALLLVLTSSRCKVCAMQGHTTPETTSPPLWAALHLDASASQQNQRKWSNISLPTCCGDFTLNLSRCCASRENYKDSALKTENIITWHLFDRWPHIR